MAGVAIKVLAGEALRRLQGLEERGDNLSGLMRFFGAYMVGSIQKNFDAEGRPVKWAAINFSTKVAWHTTKSTFWNKKATGMSKKGKEAWRSRKILTDSARLRRSISPTVMSHGIILGSNVVYAAIHQFGGQAGRGHKVSLPARPYLLFQPEDIEHFSRMLNNYLLLGKMV